MEKNAITMIRELASSFSYEELEGCLNSQINSGRNSCLVGHESDETIGILSKSSYVRELMRNGMNLSAAIRELGVRMRRYAN